MAPGLLFEELGFQLRRPHRRTSHGPPARDVPEHQGFYLAGSIHVITKKARDVNLPSATRREYHGTPPFDPETGKAAVKKQKVMSYTEVFGQTMEPLRRQ